MDKRSFLATWTSKSGNAKSDNCRETFASGVCDLQVNSIIMRYLFGINQRWVAIIGVSVIVSFLKVKFEFTLRSDFWFWQLASNVHALTFITGCSRSCGYKWARFTEVARAETRRPIRFHMLTKLTNEIGVCLRSDQSLGSILQASLIGSVREHVTLAEPMSVLPWNWCTDWRSLLLAGNIKGDVNCRCWQLAFPHHVEKTCLNGR